MCELFSKALYKKSFPVRVKKTYKLLKFDAMIEDLVYKLNKSSVSESLYFPLEQNLAFKIGGIVFFRDTKGSCACACACARACVRIFFFFLIKK